MTRLPNKSTMTEKNALSPRKRGATEAENKEEPFLMPRWCASGTYFGVKATRFGRQLARSVARNRRVLRRAIDTFCGVQSAHLFGVHFTPFGAIQLAQERLI